MAGGNLKQYRKYLVVIWGAFLAGLVFVPVFFLLVSKGLLGPLPTSDKIENPKANLASEIYSADGALLGKFYTQNRTRVEYDELSPNIVDALISTEDERYARHPGIDLEGTARAIVFMGRKGGGSTITQQLALNLFDKRAKSKLERVRQKIKEYVVAVKLEKSYTKNEIIALYLNTVDFVNNAVGIKSASKIYFNKEPSELEITEAATLVGMLKNPSLYNPLRRPEMVRDRRNVVLGQMVRNKCLDPALRDSLVATELGIKYTKEDHIEGLAPYFRSTIAQELRGWAANTLKGDGDNYDIYRDGLKIYTTIDSRLQQYAEEAVAEHLAAHQEKFFNEFSDETWTEEEGQNILDRAKRDSEAAQLLQESGATPDSVDKYWNTKKEMMVFTWQGKRDTVMTPLDSIKHHKKFLHTGFMVMDPQTGHIKAWVGGIDFEHFKYDHASKRTKRLVGSTFKPILYSIAIDNGWSPCMKIQNVPVTIYTETGEPWTPKNADNDEYGGWLTLKECLAKSKNTCAAYLMSQLQAEPLVEQAKRMGLKSDPLPVPSLALGALDVSLWEMMHIYSTFVNAGVSTQPIYISRIEDKNGTEIQRFITERKEVMSEQTAHVMLEMLQGVTTTGGTAARIKWFYQIPGEVAGKTGTTDDHTDGWFMGMTPELIGGVWVGCDDPFLRFQSLRNGSGGAMAMPIWAGFFQKAFEDKEIGLDPEGTFFEPTEEIDIVLDCEEYNQTSGDTENDIDLNSMDNGVIPNDEFEDLDSEFD
jgi:penicillin-binding protein 1A